MGGCADDDIYGGEGDDILTGNDGADTFHFLYANAGSDTITEFDISEGSKLDLSYLLDGFGAGYGADSRTVHNGESRTNNGSISDFITATEIGGNTVLTIDPNGADSTRINAVIITLSGVTGISAGGALTDTSFLELNVL